MRTVCPEARTLPSRTVATLSLWTTVLSSTFLPLKKNEEVRAATCSSLIRERELSNSSVSPSEKYSWLASPLMFTNGSTAIECGGGAKTAIAFAGLAAAGTPGVVALTVACARHVGSRLTAHYSSSKKSSMLRAMKIAQDFENAEIP